MWNLPILVLSSKVGIFKNAFKCAIRAVSLRLGEGHGSGGSGSSACHPNESRLPYECIASVYECLQRDCLSNPEGAVSVRSANYLGRRPEPPCEMVSAPRLEPGFVAWACSFERRDACRGLVLIMRRICSRPVTRQYGRRRYLTVSIRSTTRQNTSRIAQPASAAKHDE